MNLKHTAQTYFPYVFIVTLVLALVLVAFIEDPLNQMQQFFAQDWYAYSIAGYTILISLGVLLSSFSVAATIPFAAKIFGSLPIFTVVLGGWFIGSTIIYLVTRYKPTYIEYFINKERLYDYETKMPAKHNFWSVLVLRLFSPIDILSYAAARANKLSYAKYATATILGSVPIAFVLSFGAETLSAGNIYLFFTLVFLVLLIVAGYLLFEWAYFAAPAAKIYTHNGKFHTDDVFAVATLQLVLEQMKQRYSVVRTRDDKVLEQAKKDARAEKNIFIVDVGSEYDEEYNLFDHHQLHGAGKRESGMEYASFGLVWKKYGIRLAGTTETSDRVDADFVASIDAPDNGQSLFTQTYKHTSPLTFQSIFEDMYRAHSVDEPKGIDADFDEAVELAKDFIPRMIQVSQQHIEKQEQAGRLFADAPDKRMIVTTEYVGRNYFVKYPEAQLVVSPRTGDVDGDWAVATIPHEVHGMEGRVQFPASWHGLAGSELEGVSGVAGAKFCHRAGDFLCVATSREGAEELAGITLAQAEKKQNI